MGMAASQARFLGLTARKTNVEFEGQQINQQRTTLSNQTANYYNQLLGMAVPVPPSVADYTKTVYTFEDGALSNSISTMIAQANGEYLISYTSSWTDDFAAVSAGQSIVTRSKVADDKKNEQTYTYTDLTQVDSGNKDENGNILYNFTDADGNVIIAGLVKDGAGFKDKSSTYNFANGTLTQKTLINYNIGAKGLFPLGAGIPRDKDGKYSGNDEYLKTLSKDQLDKLETEQKEQIKILNNQYGNATWMVRYVQNMFLTLQFTRITVLLRAIFLHTQLGLLKKLKRLKGLLQDLNRMKPDV